MCDVNAIVARLCESLTPLFPGQGMEAILFGSYARNEAEDGSDIDVFLLVDASRERIAELHWQIGDAAADLMLDYGVVVSPIVENREYFRANADTLPFFRNIQREGVQMRA